MTIPKEILERAIESGYRPVNTKVEGVLGGYAFYFVKGQREEFKSWEEIGLDPSFWQALGKSLGWYKEPTQDDRCIHCGVDPDVQPPFSSGCNHVYYPEACNVCSKNPRAWNEKIHEFYDLILQGQPTDAFWQKLLN